MKAFYIAMGVFAIILIQAVVWFLMFRWLKVRIESLKAKMIERLGRKKRKIVIGPQSGLYRGADARYGNVKGNGVICLTGNRLIFEKVTGPVIEIDRADIVEATVCKSFKGKTSFTSGGAHLVIKTRDGNHVGFLIRETEKWARIINEGTKGGHDEIVNGSP